MLCAPCTLQLEDIARKRAAAVIALGKLVVLPDPVEFTCDGCSDRGVCGYAFDGYNTNGDCLAEK